MNKNTVFASGRLVKMLGGYLPENWEMGWALEFTDQGIKVLPVANDKLGEIIGQPVYIRQANHRSIAIEVDGLSFSKKPTDVVGELEVGRNGTLVVFERRTNQPEVAFGWTTFNHYRTALDIFDQKYSTRALNWRVRRDNPPQGMMIPQSPVAISKPEPTTPKMDSIDSLAGLKLEEVHLAPFDEPQPESRRAHRRRTNEQKKNHRRNAEAVAA